MKPPTKKPGAERVAMRHIIHQSMLLSIRKKESYDALYQRLLKLREDGWNGQIKGDHGTTIGQYRYHEPRRHKHSFNNLFTAALEDACAHDLKLHYKPTKAIIHGLSLASRRSYEL
jgi:hypothetical protein